MQVGQIFFSYSRQDAKFALKLGEDLRKAGADIWIDQIDIRPSEPWDEEIEKALIESACLLVILSKTSVASDNVLNEINYALESKKQVLPILLENDIKKPFNIGRLQHIDFTGSYESGFNRLLKSLSLGKPQAEQLKKPFRIIIPISILAGIIIIALVIFKFIPMMSDTGNASAPVKDNITKSPTSVENLPATLNGQWITHELTNPFDKFDKYFIHFNFEVFNHVVVGNIIFKSPVEYKNYEIQKPFLEGKINDNSISFYTLEQSTGFSASGETSNFKNYYHGVIAKDQIKFTLQSDRPGGFPGQTFVAKRSVP